MGLKFREWLEKIGCGLHGCAYSAGSDAVVKLTNSRAEANVARWLVDNPHPNIAKYLSVTATGGGWVIVMQKIDTDFPASKKLERLRKKAEKAGCRGPREVASFLAKNHGDDEHVAEVVSALRHVARMKGRFTDFLNPNNMGVGSDGEIRLFDFQ